MKKNLSLYLSLFTFIVTTILVIVLPNAGVKWDLPKEILIGGLIVMGYAGSIIMFLLWKADKRRDKVELAKVISVSFMLCIVMMGCNDSKPGVLKHQKDINSLDMEFAVDTPNIGDLQQDCCSIPTIQWDYHITVHNDTIWLYDEEGLLLDKVITNGRSPLDSAIVRHAEDYHNPAPILVADETWVHIIDASGNFYVQTYIPIISQTLEELCKPNSKELLRDDSGLFAELMYPYKKMNRVRAIIDSMNTAKTINKHTKI